jgi:hypothetical protein
MQRHDQLCSAQFLQRQVGRVYPIVRMHDIWFELLYHPAQRVRQFGVREGRCMPALVFGKQARHPLQRASQPMETDTILLHLTLDRPRIPEGRDIDLMTAFSQLYRQISHMAFLTPNNRRIELCEQKDAHLTRLPSLLVLQVHL